MYLRNAVEFKRLFFIPVAETVDLMMAQIGAKWSFSNSNGAIGPMRDTIKLTVAAIGIEKKHKHTVHCIPKLERVPWNPV